ncbi:hypothetical protein GH714_000532 [Hevea brasiliensis]|uniref:Uncharacterized protein n=1 Tax=Hevea brasiliensis TaxID=3981 RepID=A0A6A6NBG9_HEVBR|nr:hypothetical protein GH714_000532 [Hevea brasiliensis]
MSTPSHIFTFTPSHNKPSSSRLQMHQFTFVDSASCHRRLPLVRFATIATSHHGISFVAITRVSRTTCMESHLKEVADALSKERVFAVGTEQHSFICMVRTVRSSSFQGILLKQNLDSKVVDADALKDLRNKLAKNE